MKSWPADLEILNRLLMLVQMLFILAVIYLAPEHMQRIFSGDAKGDSLCSCTWGTGISYGEYTSEDKEIEKEYLKSYYESGLMHLLYRTWLFFR